jgi:hypothetical protein
MKTDACGVILRGAWIYGVENGMMTLRYAHLSLKHLTSVVRALDPPFQFVT